MLKRDFTLFCRSLLWAVLLTAVFAALCFGAAYAASRAAADGFKPVKAAVVDGENTPTSRLLVNMVRGMEDITALMEISPMEEAEAYAALHSGDIAAVIILPQGFVDHITDGTASRGRILLSPAAASNADVVQTAARFGERMLAAGQYGVFSGQALIQQYDLGDEFQEEFLSGVNMSLLDEALNAPEAYFDMEVTSYDATSLSTGAYYALNWLALVLFLCGIAFTRLCRADWKRPIVCRLKAAGVRDSVFLLGKFLFPMLFRAVVLLAGLWLVSDILPVQCSWEAVLCCGLSVACMGMMGTALCMCLDAGAGLTGLLGLLGIFLNGGVIPRQMLPQVVLDIAAVTPFGAVSSLLAPALGGRPTLEGLLCSLLYSGLALYGSCYALKRLRMGGGDL